MTDLNQITTYISDDTLNEIKKEAKERQWSISKMINYILVEYICKKWDREEEEK